MPSQPPTIRESDARLSTNGETDLLRGLLGHELRVEIIDGRIFEGVFVCLDKPVNLVLDHALESLSDDPHAARDVGLILIPIRHIIRVQAPSKSLTDPLLPPIIQPISVSHSFCF
ncbi:hypothetical protein PTTG_03721 [Puccinia triticina 1-1 BBBD Race 1]|uniref:Sm domain-containing protein n=2 Tax=Puccinia triticina TaxID=208348 RepID=A0A0C4ESE6_PUCT1|nr:uncharacterized protein PtA15_3A223 [Puccinia triticina]OAV92196.1 hypothetical protein PTTG_03721 [Puccinia triticina 1-1 BBBD Race 1]WAQ82858.1 hypothetical protein PtA15_3A223 [Puccinia triticina]